MHLAAACMCAARQKRRVAVIVVQILLHTASSVALSMDWARLLQKGLSFTLTAGQGCLLSWSLALMEACHFSQDVVP